LEKNGTQAIADFLTKHILIDNVSLSRLPGIILLVTVLI